MAYKIKSFQRKKVAWVSPSTFRTKREAEQVLEEIKGNIKSEEHQFPKFKKVFRGHTLKLVKV